MSQAEENLKDVEFILNELNRFAQMSREELRAHLTAPKRDGLFTLPHPQGHGMLICGYEAYQRFQALAERHLSPQKDKATKVNLAKFTQALRAEFSRRFLKDLQPIENRTIDRMLAAAYRQVEKTFDSLTHYIPCTIIESSRPPEFQVGPVRF